jgi:hypothetical protein
MNENVKIRNLCYGTLTLSDDKFIQLRSVMPRFVARPF